MAHRDTGRDPEALTALAEIEASSGDGMTARQLARQALSVHQATGHRLGAKCTHRLLDNSTGRLLDTR